MPTGIYNVPHVRSGSWAYEVKNELVFSQLFPWNGSSYWVCQTKDIITLI